MKYGDKKYNQRVAYGKIEDKIRKSTFYYEFLRYITELDGFREAFTFENDRFDAKIAGDAIESLDVLRFICNDETGLKQEDKFHDFITSAVTEKDAISTIVNTHLIEIKYGNPKRDKLNDYTPNDRLFAILESVFGLDALLLSVNDKDVLLKKFNEIMKGDNSYTPSDFIEIIESLYKISKSDEHSLFLQALEDRSEDLKPYISAGFGQQLNEISNSKHGNFDHYNNLYDMVTNDILKLSVNKKM